MTMNSARRTMLAALADTLIPEAHGMPSASAAGACDAAFVRVLKCRPDIASMIDALVNSSRGQEAKTFLADLEQREPARFELLFQAVAGAYYMSPEVRERLGYFGQQALTLPRAKIGAEDLLEDMIGAAKRFRPTQASTER